MGTKEIPTLSPGSVIPECGQKTPTARRDGGMTSGNNGPVCQSSSSPDFVPQKSLYILKYY